MANGGANQILDSADRRTIGLDGTASFDPEGQPLSFAWTQLSGPAVILTDAASASPSFVIDPVAATTELRFQLTVSAGQRTSAPAQTSVMLRPAPRPPPSPTVRVLFNQGQLQGRLVGPAGTPFAIEASSNLVKWVIIQTNTADFFGRLDFIDTDLGFYRARFYRAVPLLPANDDFAQATPIGTPPAMVFGWNLYATKQSGEPDHAGNPGGKSLWWSWLAPSDGSVTISTLGSDFDTVLAVYLGNALPQLQPVAADHNSGGNMVSSVSFNASAGQTYQIAVDGFNASTGNIQLNISMP